MFLAVGDKILLLVAHELAKEWFMFALQELDISGSVVQKCEEEYPRDLTFQAFRALKLWRDRAGKEATLMVLKQKLISFEKQLIADAIDDMSNKNYETA